MIFPVVNLHSFVSDIIIYISLSLHVKWMFPLKPAFLVDFPIKNLHLVRWFPSYKPPCLVGEISALAAAAP